MSTNPRYGRTETPINLLEPIEIDFMAGQPFDPSKYGRTETPINLLEPIEIDFAVPHLVLTLRMPDDAGAVDPDVLGVDVYHLMTALSDYERSLGGRGLRLHHKAADGAAVTLTLAPVLVENARDRVGRVADLLAQAGRRPGGGGSGSLAEALDRAASSPADRCRVELARRAWRVEVGVAA
ncbi:MAG: hypothetical protein K2X82_08850 [Gemmataceae bacterium]|nr:hypothetical protein [Gemmataceae bacterium]